MKALLVGIILAAFANVAAATTYTYTGTNYLTVSGGYTTSMQITGSFTTASPLAANLSNARIGPSGLNLVTSWSFNDGVQTLTNANSELLYGNLDAFDVSTDGLGNITAFSIGFMNPVGTNTVGQLINLILIRSSGSVSGSLAAIGATCASVTSGGVNNGVCSAGTTPINSQANSYSGGTFAATVSPPVPTALVTAPMLSWPLLVLLALLLAASTILLRGYRFRTIEGNKD